MEKKTKIKLNIIVILIIILFSIATIPRRFQEDTFYMIKVGEFIYENGMTVIENRVEPFTWHEGMSYTYPHWLLDIVFFFIFNMFSYLGIYIFTVLMGILIYLLIYYTNISIGKNNIFSAIITIFSIYLLSGFITARSQIITYICLILTILFIEKFLENGKKRYLIYLVIIPIVIANCHAALFPIYFILYLPYIAEYLITIFNRKKFYEKILNIKNKRILKNKILNKIIIKIDNKNKLLEQKEVKKDQKIIVEKNKNVKWLILVFIICIFTGLLTPLKDIPYTYTIKSIKGNTMNFISEHQPVVLIQNINILGVFLFIQFLLFSNKLKIKLRDLFMLFGMSILALISYKQFPIFLICTMFIINKSMNMVLDEKIKEKIIKLVNIITSNRNIIYTILIIIIVFLMQYKNTIQQSFVNVDEYPTLAVEWMKKNINIDEMNLFNDFNYGSYLLFQDIPVFIDGRADVYDPEFNGKIDDIFKDYMIVTSLQTWYADIFKKYDVTHIITKANSNLNIFLQRNVSYKMIYNDGSFSIYEPRKL